jgi:hypothetical protein
VVYGERNGVTHGAYEGVQGLGKLMNFLGGGESMFARWNKGMCNQRRIWPHGRQMPDLYLFCGCSVYHYNLVFAAVGRKGCDANCTEFAAITGLPRNSRHPG